jgi:hypothetical protein
MVGLVCLALVCLLALSPAVAQTTPADTAPIILWSQGSLYQVVNPQVPPSLLVQSGVISGVALSPDGSRLAYRAAAPVGIEALGRLQTEGMIAEFDLPADIFILDLTTLSQVQIAAQPDAPSLFVEGVADNATVRSAPVWSPDGSALAWTQMQFGAPVADLYRYQLDQAFTVLVPIAMPVVRGAAPELSWGAGGIAISAGANTNGQQEFYIYTPDGALRSLVRLSPQEGESLERTTWVEDENLSLFGALFSSGRWALFDPASGLEVAVNGVPELYSLTAPETSLGLRFAISPDVGFYWETHDPMPSENASGAYPGSPWRVTLSPNGRAAAFLGYPTYTGAAIWRDDGSVTELAGTGESGLNIGEIFWGATGWRVGE